MDVGGDAALLNDATHDLLADLVGVFVIGTSLEQLVTFADQGECLRSVSWVPTGGGPAAEFNAGPWLH